MEGNKLEASSAVEQAKDNESVSSEEAIKKFVFSPVNDDLLHVVSVSHASFANIEDALYHWRRMHKPCFFCLPRSVQDAKNRRMKLNGITFDPTLDPEHAQTTTSDDEASEKPPDDAAKTTGNGHVTTASSNDAAKTTKQKLHVSWSSSPPTTLAADAAGADMAVVDEHQVVIIGRESKSKRERPEDAALLVRLTKGDEVTILDKWGKRKNRVVFIDDRTTVLRKFSKSMFAIDGTKRIIALREVNNIMDGAHTEAFQRHSVKGMENRCFSLVFNNGCKTIDFLCSDPGIKKAWVHGLTLIISRLMPTVQTADDIAQSYFQLADLNGDGRLSVDEIMVLLKRLHLSLDRRYVKDLFKMVEDESDVQNKDNQLDRKEFLKFVKILYHCREIESIYDSAKGGNDFLNLANFAAFMSTFQKQFLQQPMVEKIMRRHELSVSLRGSDLLSYEGFRSYLISEENSLIKPEALNIYQDMTQPLTHYWIFSSHNTYLIGNQLTGDSSLNGYTSSLTRGCRCVEIDSWDGEDGEPIVTHGHTLTSKLQFSDVVKAIKHAAFLTSPFPVIISIENHCSVAQQKRMTDHMKVILGDALCTSFVDPVNPSRVLSPDALRNKFIIKGKTIGLPKQASSATLAGIPPANNGGSLKQGNSSGTLTKSNSITETSNDDPETPSALPTPAHSNAPAEHGGKTAKELSDITAMASCKFDITMSKQVPTGGVSSLVESETSEVVHRELEQLLAYTERYFIRVYPAGHRTNSGNYQPMPGLMGGCQLVALNFQTPDKHYKIYSGFFNDNGFSGVILKQLEAPVSPPMTLKLRVISGYQLGKNDDLNVRDILDPYVIVRTYGALKDKARYQTSVVKDNGFNPIWNESFTFQITRPDIALLRFIVMDENSKLSRNDFISQYTIPVRLVREGFRYIRLDSEHSTCSALLVHVTIA